ncbi:hypothetical protein BU15DRAFT_66415, partial [Melanogaster broomeanus]
MSSGSNAEFLNPQWCRSTDRPLLPPVWTAGHGIHRYQWTCNACRDNKWRDQRGACRHEKQQSHKSNVEYLLTRSPSLQPEVTGPLLDLLKDLSQSHSSDAVDRPQTQPFTHAAPFDQPPPPEAFELDWDAIDHDELMPPSIGETSVATLAAGLADWLARNEQEYGADDDQPEPLLQGAPRAPQRSVPVEDPNWFPWPDKETCILDILRHLPRSLFSDAQMQVILWGVSVLGVDNIPSTGVLKDLDESLQHKYGIESVRYEGPLGHVYYVNHLSSIIAQEIANPRICPHIRHYPEDAGQHLGEPWQASRWLNEIDPSLITPMIRVRHQDYYVFEPTKLTDGNIIVPERWYTKMTGAGSAHHEEFWARAWCAQPVANDEGYRSYLINTNSTIDIPADQLLLSFPNLVETYRRDNLPDPRNIIGILNSAGVAPWHWTDPAIGNRWRVRARGHRVLSYMMWLYCDDTSGNVSKKWNKHNSFLFTSAGLPRTFMHKESNIHFLSTSNIAPPLEMLDGIVTQLEDAQAHGIWAWDVTAKEMVLIIPTVLAILGDNPMQSELACHIGLQAKYFCRSCWVKGHEAPEKDSIPSADHTADVSSVHSESEYSTHGEGSGTKMRGRRKETMQDLVDRARRFLGDNHPRKRDETVSKLKSMFQDVLTTGVKTHYQKTKTETGIKDTFMEVFVDRIFKPMKGYRGGSAAHAKAVKEVTQGRDVESFLSPIWRIKGLDPHQDTPVEILHVILLGFIKYFWRDAISRLNDIQKSLLITRLTSFNVAGLGIPQLAGQTLVQYAGSLTGRDFRAISQAAPFVLYDLVPPECYDTFVALSSLVPLVWQPVIENLDVHLDAVQTSIDHFLNCTVRWTPRWFNKPKFHIIRHLPDHIRRLGPPILFATEGFESFNAVIRDHSVHSNRQAPSRDIARGFARCNRTRHFLSGGYFMSRENADGKHDGASMATMPYSSIVENWRVVGRNPAALTRFANGAVKNIIAEYYGLSDEPDNSTFPGTCIPDNSRPRTLEKTSTSVHLPDALPAVHRRLYQTCKSLTAHNGNICKLYQFVLASDQQPQSNGVCHTPPQWDGQANYVLIEVFRIVGLADTYHLPLLRSAGWKLMSAQSLLCSVNVQHNCAANSCTDAAFATVYEEREATSKKGKRMEHRSLDDVVLNTAQMRDAIYVQQFRMRADQLDRDQAIHA